MTRLGRTRAQKLANRFRCWRKVFLESQNRAAFIPEAFEMCRTIAGSICSKHHVHVLL